MTTKTKKPTKPKCRLSDERVIAEEYEEAKQRSMRIRRPTDIRPVRWSCNPDKRWIHLTEDEWIALCDAFAALEKELWLEQEMNVGVK